MDTAPQRSLQPLLHDAVVALRAPSQAWSRADGSIGGSAIDGVYFSDLRVLDRLSATVAGHAFEPIATRSRAADDVEFAGLLRHLDDGSTADPDVLLRVRRRVRADGVHETFELVSRRDLALDVDVRVDLRADLTDMTDVKSGASAGAAPEVTIGDHSGARWGADGVIVELRPGEFTVTSDGPTLALDTRVTVPARGSIRVGFEVVASDARAVIAAPKSAAPWTAPSLDGLDDRLQRWMRVALDDLDALRAVRPGSGAESDDQFLAAGAPWFLTLFGRDAIWAARLVLPLDSRLAGGTLRALAELQGRASVAETAEQPGKIPHEVRRASADHGDGMTLPPLYYGTVDATPLWVCLLHDAWRAGMPDAEVRELLPALEAALAWMRDFGDSDGDGLLEYVDETGRGLSNQGWKDSGDSVQWRDGRLADGPIALVEVQGYAYEAAVHGADVLDAFGRPGADDWRDWAERLRVAVADRFWVQDADGAFPAIALDAQKRAVDSLTSNIGHLLGTGMLTAAESALVAGRLVSPELSSGYGVRTMSTLEAGYWPLSYHGGSVWAHDTAIAVRGLARDGFVREAGILAEGLLAAAPAFDYRMPELYSGDAASDAPRPLPYPAACRPQAWSAAAAVAVWDALN